MPLDVRQEGREADESREPSRNEKTFDAAGFRL